MLQPLASGPKQVKHPWLSQQRLRRRSTSAGSWWRWHLIRTRLTEQLGTMKNVMNKMHLYWQTESAYSSHDNGSNYRNKYKQQRSPDGNKTCRTVMGIILSAATSSFGNFRCSNTGNNENHEDKNLFKQHYYRRETEWFNITKEIIQA